MKNYIFDMLTTIKNGQLAKKRLILQKKQKFCLAFLNVLWDEGYINGYSIKNNNIKIFLKYKNKTPVINSLKLITKPGHKTFLTLKHLWKINFTEGVLILSTNKGLMTLENCKKFKLGGQPFIILK